MEDLHYKFTVLLNRSPDDQPDDWRVRLREVARGCMDLHKSCDVPGLLTPRILFK